MLPFECIGFVAVLNDGLMSLANAVDLWSFDVFPEKQQSCNVNTEFVFGLSLEYCLQLFFEFSLCFLEFCSEVLLFCSKVYFVFFACWFIFDEDDVSCLRFV